MVDMSSIMLMRLQELCKNCASLVGRPVILFNFILFYCKWANRLTAIDLLKQYYYCVFFLRA